MLGMGARTALLALVLSAGAHAASVENLDLPVRTPVYRVPDGASLPEASYGYALRWGGLPVGRATVTIRSGTGGLAVEMNGASNPAIDWLYRYRVVARGRVSTGPFAPDHFVVDQCARGRRELTEIRFPRSDAAVRGVRQRKGRTREYVFHSKNTYDIPSATFLLLNLDYAPGAHYEIDTFTGKDRYLLRAEVEAAERVALGEALHDAWRLRLETRHLNTDRDRERHRGTTLWVSRQRPRRVLRARSETFVGALTLELESVAGAGELPAVPEADGRCA